MMLPFAGDLAIKFILIPASDVLAKSFRQWGYSRAKGYTERVLELIEKVIGNAAMVSSRPVYSKLNTPWP